MRVTSHTAGFVAPILVAAVLLPVASAQPAAPPPGATQVPSGPVRKLTLDEAVASALEQNLNIQVQRISPLIQDENIGLAQSAFVPNLTSDFSYNKTETPPDSFLVGTTDTLQSDQILGTAGVQQQLPWGGSNYTVGWDGSRFTTNSVFSTFNPRLRSNLRFSFTQPLMRNFSTDSTRTQLIVSKRNREISDTDFRGAVVQTVRNVKNAYWNLKAAIANLEVQRQSLELARQTLKDNRTRVEVGTMAPIDIVEAEAEVARNEETVIVAEATIKQAEDLLRTIIFDPDTPNFWTTTLEPVDAPQMGATTIDIEGAVRNALDKRTDLQSTKMSLENVETNLKLYRNQVLPQVNVEVNYGTTGLGGTEFIRGPGFPGEIIGEVSRPFSDVLADVLTFDYPAWTLGVVFSYPLGRSAADASYARAELERRQALLQIKNLELSIGTQVRDVGRQVNTNAKRVEATRASRVLAERRLEAEQKKFGVGMSTSFLVFQAQRDLATARVNELSAVLDYNKSLVDFEAVQEAALSGGGITLSGGGGFVATTAGATVATGLNRQR